MELPWFLGEFGSFPLVDLNLTIHLWTIWFLLPSVVWLVWYDQAEYIFLKWVLLTSCMWGRPVS